MHHVLMCTQPAKPLKKRLIALLLRVAEACGQVQLKMSRCDQKGIAIRFSTAAIPVGFLTRIGAPVEEIMR